MSAADFSSIRNFHERAVFEAVTARAPHYPLISAEQLPDVACVALNRLPPRYIRHEVDLVFYLTERERLENERSVDESVQFAFEFVQARTVMRARR
ncbi:MAG: late competence development ComFB family protein [Pseudomonadota bacterium]